MKVKFAAAPGARVEIVMKDGRTFRDEDIKEIVVTPFFPYMTGNGEIMRGESLPAANVQVDKFTLVAKPARQIAVLTFLMGKVGLSLRRHSRETPATTNR